MSAAADLNDPEFSLDSDDWFNDSPPPVLDIFSQDPNAIHSFDDSDAKRLLSPGPHLTLPRFGGSPGSPLSSPQDSSSDASSSKRTRSSASAKARSSGGDTMMTDLELKQEWNVDDYLHLEDDPTFKFEDDTVNPKSIEQAFDGNPFQSAYDFGTASTGPPLETAAAAVTAASHSPAVFSKQAALNASPAESRPANRSYHAKAFSVSLRPLSGGIRAEKLAAGGIDRQPCVCVCLY